MLEDCTAFIFDLDGTLVTTDLDFPSMKAAVVRLAGEFGFAPDELGPLDILGAVDSVCARLDGAGIDFRNRADAVLADWEVAGARRAREIDDAVATLAALRGHGHQVGIVTRNCRVAVAEALRRVPLPHDALLTRNDVAHAKPHPEHLERMLEALRADPSDAVMVVDHWMDVQAGRRAGMLTVGILDAHGPERFEKMAPDLLLRSVSEISHHMDLTCESAP
jgi:HAD superfamily hydrolase (TIGR01549 family)